MKRQSDNIEKSGELWFRLTWTEIAWEIIFRGEKSIGEENKFIEFVSNFILFLCSLVTINYGQLCHCEIVVVLRKLHSCIIGHRVIDDRHVTTNFERVGTGESLVISFFFLRQGDVLSAHHRRKRTARADIFMSHTLNRNLTSLHRDARSLYFEWHEIVFTRRRHSDHRQIIYLWLFRRETTNCIWVSTALCNGNRTSFRHKQDENTRWKNVDANVVDFEWFSSAWSFSLN